MGAPWISWRTTAVVIITILQIQALISVKTRVTRVEGQHFNFSCKYKDGWQKRTKFFCHVVNDSTCDHRIQTDKHNKSVSHGRYSLYDNTSGAYVLVEVKELTLEDSGTYRCGVDSSSQPNDTYVIELNVSQAHPRENTIRFTTISPVVPGGITVYKLHLPLYLTAVMCVAAIMSVCLFTLCLLLVVKHNRSGPPQQARETSSDYETMMPSVRTEPEFSCTCPDCHDASLDGPPPPPDLCSHFTPKHRESTVTLGLSEYVDVDVPGLTCQYQHLDTSQLENHVYHSLHGNSGSKDAPLEVIEQMKC